MSYFLADSNGPLVDFASIGGLADFREWAKNQPAVVRHFAFEGFTEDVEDLVAALEKNKPPQKIQEQFDAILEAADNAEDILIISDGTSDVEPEARSAEFRSCIIRKKGKKWVLFTKDGSKILGIHDSEKDAIDQERAIEAAKHRHATAHPRTAVHDAADAYYKRLMSAVQFAFLRGREAIDPDKLAAAKTKSEFDAAVAGVPDAIEQALLQVLPSTLTELLTAGGEAGLLLLRQKLKVAGGKGSGNFGHAGRPGQVGGSDAGLDESLGESMANRTVRAFKDAPKQQGRMTTRMVNHLADRKKLKDTAAKSRPAINQLKNEIAVHGFKNSQPILVEQKGFGRYTISDGYKRLIAANELRIPIIPVRIGKSGEETENLHPVTKGRRPMRRLTAAAKKKVQSSTPPFSMQFDAKNENAIEWVKKHSLELAKDLSKTSKENIADALESAFEEGSVDGLRDSILDEVGDETRADVIARTESMIAANEGQRQSWDQAVDEGLLTGDEQRVWIASADGKLCPDCEELDGETADLDGEYPGDGGDGPPLHPNCRCTEGIIGV